jgi:hypothetical protein
MTYEQFCQRTARQVYREADGNITPRLTYTLARRICLYRWQRELPVAIREAWKGYAVELLEQAARR